MNKLTYSELYEVIDNYIECKRDFSIICDKELAEDISDYTCDYKWDNQDETFDERDEYLVSFDFSGNSNDFYIEPLRTKKGIIKVHETADLFIGLDLEDGQDEIERKIECKTLSYFELVDKDESNKCNCIICNIDSYVERLQNTCCPHCIKEIIEEIVADTINFLNTDED